MADPRGKLRAALSRQYERLVEKSRIAPEYHVRVDTPRTLERLLSYGGFKVEKINYKGGVWAPLDNGGILTMAKRAVAILAFWLSPK